MTDRTLTQAVAGAARPLKDGAACWDPNRRDPHVADTLHALDEHLGARRGRPARLVVWAHNSHLGDATATEMGESGELNLGQLVRERYGAANARLVGFTTHSGTVTAASEWDAPAELKHVRDSHPDSFERLLHDNGIERFCESPEEMETYPSGM